MYMLLHFWVIEKSENDNFQQNDLIQIKIKC